jgi:stage II sporulation protein D
VTPLSLRTRPGAVFAAAVAATLALAMSCRTLPPAPAIVVAPTAFSADALVPAPVVRVGIVTDASRVSIGAESGVAVWVLAEGRAPRRIELPIATFRRSGAEVLVARLFRVQIASVADEGAAKDAGERARAALGVVPSVAWNRDTGTFQVRVGSLETREDGLAFARKLGEAGFRGAFVVEEARPASGTGVKLLESGDEVAMATVVPARPGEALSVDSVPYRGLLEIRSGEPGVLTVVNVLNMEDYLKGVVPNELSPLAFPQMEALKAQAVAARTYALKNKGQSIAKGYDLCATPACQVYRGKSTESPLSDQAVEATRGLVAEFNDLPIDALYTSTCGGHTEDGANMFEGDGAPYLKGVVCAPERSASVELRSASPVKALGDEDGLNRDAALLISLDVVDAKLYAPSAVKGNAADGDLRDWTARLLAALRRRGCDSPSEAAITRRAAFFTHLVASLCWDERGRRLLAPGDPDYLLQVEDAATLATSSERMAAAVLLQEGVLSPFSDNTLRGNEPVTRSQALRILARVAEKAGAPGLVNAELASIGPEGLKVRRGSTLDAFQVDPAARLFRSLDGSLAATSELNLTGGDKVHFVADGDRITFLEADQSRLGASADKSSRYFRWEVRLSPSELAGAIARYGSVGRVRDVEIRRIGVSGRVVDLSVIGASGELPLKGLKIRWALGLKENLFVVDRERDEKGDVTRFVFTGKGWGHGVGLCQVGAYGMAQAGASFEQILRHYYTGIRLDRAY